MGDCDIGGGDLSNDLGAGGKGCGKWVVVVEAAVVLTELQFCAGSYNTKIVVVLKIEYEDSGVWLMATPLNKSCLHWWCGSDLVLVFQCGWWHVNTELVIL